jgi:hypothetical protein
MAQKWLNLPDDDRPVPRFVQDAYMGKAVVNPAHQPERHWSEYAERREIAEPRVYPPNFWFKTAMVVLLAVIAFCESVELLFAKQF